MKNLKKTRISPSLKDYRIVCDFLEARRRERGLTLKRFAEGHKHKISTVSEALGRVNKKFQGKLFSRKSGKLEVKPTAWNLYPRIERLIEDEDLLLRSPVEVAARPVAPFRIVATPGIYHYLCQGCRVRTWLNKNGEYGVDFHPWFYPEMLVGLSTGRVQLAIAPKLPPQALAGYEKKVGVQEFETPVDVVLIFHPSHRYAVEKRFGERSNVLREELATLRLLMPSPHVAPAVCEQLPAPLAGGEHCIKDDLRQIYYLVREGREWVGLAPGFYWLLNGERCKRRLDYLPISGIDPFRIAAYFPIASKFRQEQMVGQFLKFFDEHLMTRLFSRPKLVIPRECSCIQGQLREFGFEQYLSCHPGLTEGLRWFCDDVRFEVEDRSVGLVSGTVTSGEGRRYMYKFTGQVSQWFLSYIARDCQTGEEYSAVLKCFRIDEEEFLVGTWGGRDNLGQWVGSARMVLSRKALSAQTLNQIAQRIDETFLIQPRPTP